MLLDSNEREVGRTVADESGLFLIRAVVASGYRLMVQLAGYRSSTFPPFDLGPDEVAGFMLLVASSEPTPAEITAEEFVAEICEEGSVQPGQGVVYGFVLEADSHEPLPNTLVKVIWAAISGGLAGLTGVSNLPYMSASLPVDSAGFYAACGVAPRTDMSIHAASGALLTDFATVRFDEGGVFSDGVFHASDEALWRQDFVLNSPGHRTARLTGVVTELVGSDPVRGAVVQIVETELQAVTDASGAFSMANLPAGRVKISVRSPGMTELNLEIELREGETVIPPAEVLSMEPLPTELAPVVVETDAPSTRRPLTEFFERRRSGQGSYLMREEWMKMGNPQKPSDVLRRMGGLRIVGIGRTLRITSRRGGCLPSVFIDRMYIGNTGGLDSRITVEELEAVEVYTPATTPPQYNRTGAGTGSDLGSGCGVILFWTR